MSRPGTSGSGSRPGTSASTSSLKDLEAELRAEHALTLQRLARRFLARSRVLRIVAQRFEKIWDPRRQTFYYYDRWHLASNPYPTQAQP